MKAFSFRPDVAGGAMLAVVLIWAANDILAARRRSDACPAGRARSVRNGIILRFGRTMPVSANSRALSRDDSFRSA